MDWLTLLVANEMLGTCNGTSILNALNALCHSDTGKDWIWRESLPVSATCRHTTNGSGDWSEKDGDSLALGLGAHGVATSVHQTPVPCGRGCLAGGEDRVVISAANSDR